ncbi:MAG TPA: PAS domain S-box protein [Terriglobales bacterium]|nr:PAS domain S-box protein [Terriglobales bacterium]
MSAPESGDKTDFMAPPQAEEVSGVRVDKSAADGVGNESERYQTREELEKAINGSKKSEIQLRKIIDAIPTLAWCNLPDGSTEFVNQRWLDYTGLSPHEARGWGWKVVIHPEDQNKLLDKQQALRASGEPFEAEARLRRHDGEYRWFLSRTAPLRDEMGNIVRWYGSATDIESLKQTEEKLEKALNASKKSEDQLRKIIDTIPTLAHCNLPDGSAEFANRRWLDYTGLSQEEATGYGYKSAIHPDDLGKLMDKQRTLRASGEAGEIEARLRRRDGKYRWFLFRTAPLRDETGKIVRWYGTTTDIEALKETEEKLEKALIASEKSEKQLRKIIDTIPALAWCVLPDGSAEFLNQRWLDYTGLSAQEAQGSGWKVVFHPEELAKGLDEYLTILSSGEPGEIEARMRRHDGEYRRFLIRLAPLRDEMGNIVKWYGTNTDIEALKQTEEKLRLDEQQLRQITDSIANVVFTLDPSGVLLYANRTSLDYTGVTREELPTLDLRQKITPPQDLERLRDLRRQGLASGLPFEVEQRLLGKDGVYRWFLLRYNPFRDGQGRLVEWYVTGTDIESLKQTEEKLRQSEHGLRRITDFIPVMILTQTPDGTLLYANQTMLDYSGHTREELSTFDLRQKSMKAEDLDKSRVQRQIGLSGGQPFEYEQRILGNDGRYRWFLVRYNPFRDEQGQLVHWYVTCTDIEALKQTEEKLEKAFKASQESEARLQKIFNAMPVFAWSSLPDGNSDFANQRWLDYMGLREEEALGLGWVPTIHPADLDRTMNKYRACLASGKAGEVEVRIRRHDGQYRWLLCRIAPLRDEAGNIVKWYGTNTDIDSLKQTEEKLEKALAASEKSEEQLREVLDTIPTAAWYCLPDGSNEYVSQRWLAYTGLSAKEAHGDGWKATIHPEDLGRAIERASSILASGEPGEIEERVRRHDGEFRWFMVRYAPLRDEMGNIVRWYGTNTDIDDRKRSEEKLRDDERELRQITDAIPQLITTQDANGTFLYANQTLLDYTGLTMEGFVSSDFRRVVIHPEDVGRARNQREAGLASGQPFEFEHRVRRKDGEYRWFLVRYNPFRDEHGRVVRWYAAGTDIDDRKRSEEQLQKSERELRRITDAIPQLIVTLDPSGVPLYVNQALIDYNGFTREDAVKSDLRERTFHPEDLERVRGERQAAFSLGLPFELEQRIRGKDGQYRWFLIQYNPFRDEHGRLLRWYSTGTDIDDRKRSEDRTRNENVALREEDDRLRKIIDTIPTAAWCHLADGSNEFVNQRWIEYSGLSSQEAQGWGWKVTIHPEDAGILLDEWSAHVASGDPFEMEARLRRHDGEYRWFLCRAAPLRDEMGNIVRWYGTNTDIDDRKKAQVKLRQDEEELRRITDAIPHMILTQDLNGAALYANQAVLNYAGMTVEDVLSPDYRQRFIHPEDIERLRDERKAGYASGLPFLVEQRLRGKDGQYRWFQIRYTPFRDEQGLLLRWYSTGIDIDDRKRSEDRTRNENVALREEDAQLRKTIDTIPTLAWSSLPDGSTEFVNQRLSDYTGLSLEQVRSSGWEQAVHPEDLSASLEKWSMLLVSGQPGEIEGRLRRRDGEYRRFLFRLAPLRDEIGNIVRWYGTATDVEELKQTEEKLRQDEHELRRITDCLPYTIVTQDPGGHTLYANQMLLDYSGIAQEDLATSELRSLIVHPEDVERSWDERRAAYSRGLRFEVEQRLRRKDGQYRWFLVRFSPFRDEQGRLVRWYASGTDIDDRKRSEERTRNENVALREEVVHASMFEEIVGSSGSLRKALAQVEKVAPTDSTVLILGESGTGKELIARAIHNRSKRANRAFIKVNLAAIPASLIASELFGHEKGSFTGALQRRLGRFEQADGGTLFLDEIGEPPPETQVALLRVLQEREFERVGGSQTVSVDVRVLAATNRDLTAAVAEGTFREDLFYRLNVFPIRLPALRERGDDIRLLVEYLIDRYAQKAGKKIRNISKETLDLFRTYDWPGNIRELQNVVERAVILCDGETFSVDESWLTRSASRSTATGAPLVANLVEREKEMIENALREAGGVIGGPNGAAAKLGIPRQTLESKIRKLGINRHRFKTP